MLQVIYERDFRLILAPEWPHGLKGSVPLGTKRYWIVCATRHFLDEPMVFEKLEDAVQWIKQKAGQA